MSRIAQRERCDYTRYADDIVFSTSRSNFPASLATVVEGGVALSDELLDSIQREDFRVNHEKTRLLRTSHRQRVLGCVVNARTNVPREYVRQLRTALYLWGSKSEQAASDFLDAKGARMRPEATGKADFQRVIRGRIQYLGYVRGFDDPLYARLARDLQRLDNTFVPRILSARQRRFNIRLFAEGPTDYDHIQAALTRLQEMGEYHGLSVEYAGRGSKIEGDSQLEDYGKALSRHHQRVVTVLLYDRDVSATVSRVLKDPAGYRDCGNNVLETCIVPPAWVTDEAVCVEMLYSEAILRAEDGEGRRIFLKKEFSQERMVDATGRFFSPDVRRTGLVVTKAYGEIGLEAPNRALSKKAFARAIFQRQHPYERVEFDGFRPTLDHLMSVLVEHDERRRRS